MEHLYSASRSGDVPTLKVLLAVFAEPCDDFTILNVMNNLLKEAKIHNNEPVIRYLESEITTNNFDINKYIEDVINSG